MLAINIALSSLYYAYAPDSHLKHAVALSLFVTCIIDTFTLNFPLSQVFHVNPLGLLIIFRETIVTMCRLSALPMTGYITMHMLGLFDYHTYDVTFETYIILSYAILRMMYFLWFCYKLTQKEPPIRLEYPRGFVMNAVWGFVYTINNQLICSWMSVFIRSLIKQFFEAISLQPLFHNPLNRMPLLQALIIGYPLGNFVRLMYFTHGFSHIWQKSHAFLHTKNHGVYLMAHKQHHINRTPMPLDSNTENAWDIFELHWILNFTHCNRILSFWYNLKLELCGLKGHDPYGDLYHLAHHQFGDVNNSFPETDVDAGTISKPENQPIRVDGKTEFTEKVVYIKNGILRQKHRTIRVSESM